MSTRRSPIHLFDHTGRRKYLSAEERARFLAAAALAAPRIEAFCLLLHFTGCRISEGLGLRAEHLDFEAGSAALQTLKQRQSGIYRSVPLPPMLFDKLRALGTAPDAPLFPWHRATAWAKIKTVMARAGIEGPHACPRGLRHGFGVAAVTAGVPVTLVQRWLGHTKLETTAIYLSVMGREERRFASRIWRKAG